MSNGRRSPDDAPVPAYWHDAILRQACFSALMLSLTLGALSVLGLILRPHWLWAAPIILAVLSLSLTLRLRHATPRGTVAILSVAVSSSSSPPGGSPDSPRSSLTAPDHAPMHAVTGTSANRSRFPA